MNQNLFLEDISTGMEIPTIKKDPTTQQLVKYAGASGDFYQIHYDMDYAKNNGLPGVILHGALKNAFLAQLLTDWIGFDGRLKKLSVQYRGMDVPDVTLTCRGRVIHKYQVENEFLVDCEIWIDNSQGQTTTLGTATIVIPSNGIEA